MTEGRSGGLHSNPLALMIAGVSAAVGVVMLYRSRVAAAEAMESDSEVAGPTDGKDSKNNGDSANSRNGLDQSPSGRNSVGMTSSSNDSISMVQELQGTGLPASVLSRIRSQTTAAGRRRLWVDEQIGLTIDFPTSTLELVREERRSPAMTVKFKVLKDGGPSSVTVVLEQCATDLETHSMPNTNYVLGKVTARSYQENCLEKLQDCATILNTDDVTHDGIIVPSIYYCYENEETRKVWYVRSIFFTHDHWAAMIQFQSKQQMKALPTGIAPVLKWEQAKPTPSVIMCSEPRFGFGFCVPIHFQLSRSDEFVDQDQVAGDGGSSSSIWAELVSKELGQVVVARYERYQQRQWAIQDVAPKVVKRYVDSFGIKGMPVVNMDNNANPKGYHISLKPLTVTTAVDESHPTPTKLEGLCGALNVKLEPERTLDDLDDAASSVSRSSNPKLSRESSKRKLNTRGRKEKDSGPNGTLVIYLFAIRTEYVSIAFLNKDTSKTSSGDFTQFASNAIRTLNLGNHRGQDTACVYMNRRHDHPFTITLPSSTGSTKLIEPILGDPLVVIQHTGLQHHILYIRPFAAPVMEKKTENIVMAKFERRLSSMLQMLPGKCTTDSSRRIEIKGIPGVEIVHSHELLQDTSMEGLDDAASRDASQDPLGHHDSLHLDIMSNSDAVSISTSATTADMGGEEFTLDNPMSQFDYSQLIDIHDMQELADQPQEGDQVSKRISIILCHRGVAYLFRICSSPYMFEQAKATIHSFVRNFAFMKSDD